MTPFQVLVGDRDLSAMMESLTVSAVDPGGYEISSLGLPAEESLAKGAPWRVLLGLEPVWWGRVAEDQDASRFGRSTTGLSGEGAGAALKDDPYSMIYADREFASWKGASVERKNVLLGLSIDVEDPAVKGDPVSGQPSLMTAITGAWARAHRCEAYYDAGEGQAIASLYFAWKKSVVISESDGNWDWSAYLSDEDSVIGSADWSGSLRAAGPGSGTVTATGSARRFALMLLSYAVGAGGAGQEYPLYWTCLAAYGPHGLPKRGANSATDAQGFYPSDIARHAIAQASDVVPGVVEEASSYIVRHYLNRVAVMPEQVLTDMAGLMGWHWGAWEPFGAFGTTPRVDFRAPPADATAFVRRSDCEQFDVSTRLGNLYDTALVRWQDSAGQQRVETVRVANTLLQEAGLSRTLPLDAGLSTQVGARNLGQVALLLSQTSARAAGSVTLPLMVGVAGGGYKPACLLKPGLDRLRVLDLPDAGPVTATDTRRRDTFRIRRVETTIEKNGLPKTRVEIDDGQGLLEVLQARLTAATQLAGG